MSREYILHRSASDPQLRIDYKGELNPQQYAAVSAGEGPALVLAGAGAGKTRTLIYRVAWLLEHGVPPERILLLTFTNKAAREMMERVRNLVAIDLERLWGGTFHSMASRILRRHAELLGYRRDFTIADREDTRDLLDACIGDMVKDVTEHRFPKADVLASIFSMAANTGKPLEEVIQDRYVPFLEVVDSIRKVEKAFRERKRQVGMMDFDDLLVFWRDLLRDNALVREQYQRRFNWVLVDEYQDTNHLQGEVIDLLVQARRNLMAVGDDAQSIYSWRGADFTNILDFERRYESAKVFRVEINYRSTPEILEVANACISANVRQFPKNLKAHRPSGMRPAVVLCADTRDQATFVAQRALELRDEGVGLKNMCVLYRSHFHALQLQMELTHRGIPFVITSGIRFFEQAHIKDLVAYLRLLHFPRDELAFRRLIRMLPGIGGKTAEKLWRAYSQRLENLFASDVPTSTSSAIASTADEDGEDEGGLEDDEAFAAVGLMNVKRQQVVVAMAAISDDVPRKATVAWAKLMTILAECANTERFPSPGAILEHVLAADYKEYLHATFENAVQREEDCRQLAGFASQFNNAAAFLSDMALQSEMESDAGRKSVADEERLRLSTVHQAKGLEFDAVFVLMLAEGMFPSSHATETSELEEEERRLFYVAITRARNELYLMCPETRMSSGGGMMRLEPSRFLREIPEPLVEPWNLRSVEEEYDPWAVPDDSGDPF